MAIPTFNEHGWLPEGVHDCGFDEAARRFGSFQASDRRPRLWASFAEFVRETRVAGIVESLVLDGSFITARSDPNDIDLVVVVPANHDFSVELPPTRYNVLDQKRVRKRFGLDIVVAKNDSENLEWAIAFFQQVKQQPGLRKGLVRIIL